MVEITQKDIDFMTRMHREKIEELENQVTYYRDIANKLMDKLEMVDSYLYDEFYITIEEILEKIGYEEY